MRDVSTKINANNRQNEKPHKITGAIGIYYDTTNGLKRNFAFGFGNKTYRFKTLEEAMTARQELKETLNE